MKKMLLTTSLITLPLVLFGCGEEKIYTVTEFAENEDLRKEWMAKCKENPGELRMTPNCTNAFAGQKKFATNELLRRSEKTLRRIEEENSKSD